MIPDRRSGSSLTNELKPIKNAKDQKDLIITTSQGIEKGSVEVIMKGTENLRNRTGHMEMIMVDIGTCDSVVYR